jgi:uncharacterized membrane protein
MAVRLEVMRAMQDGPTPGEKETGRVEAFSDGVFAIAITLLVLELKVPHDMTAPLWPELARQWPSYLALVTSFVTIAIMWINHHMLFTHVRRVDRPLMLLNAWVLFGTSLVPFPTALVAARLGHPGAELAASVYSGTFLFTAVAFNLFWRYASSARRQPSLVRDPHGPEVAAITAQYRFGPLVYAVALALSTFHAVAGVVIDLALAVFFALPPRRPTEAGPR